MPAVYPVGLTTIIWTATDACGNESICEQTVNVSADNLAAIDVQLSPTVTDGITRCITFEFFNCDGQTSYTVNQPVTLGAGGLASGVEVLVPCNQGPFTCVTASDRLHTLRRNVPLTTSDGNYIAALTGVKSLTGGNLNNDDWIDVLDFGIFTGQFNQSLPPAPCGASGPHADISGDGVVHTGDFTFIQINFLEGADAACCGGEAASTQNPEHRTQNSFAGSQNSVPRTQNSLPVTRISVPELWARGLGQLTVADLNGDGWLDQFDIAAFLNGTQPPQLSVFVAGHNGSWFDASSWGNRVVPDAQTNVVIPGGSRVVIDGQAGDNSRNGSPAQGGAVANAVTALSGATIRLTGGGSLSAQSLTIAAGAVLAIDDARALLSVRNLTLEPGATLMFKAGIIEIDGGTLAVGNDHLVIGSEPAPVGPGGSGSGGAATLRLMNGATVDAAEVTVTATGTIEGASGDSAGRSGTILGLVHNAGRIVVDGGGGSGGLIEIIGDLMQGANGSIQVDLSGDPEAARLSVHGNAILDGHLKVTLLQHYIPAVGSRFNLIGTAAGASGTISQQFATVELPALGMGLVFTIEYGSNSVSVEVEVGEF